jgi:hypothetical protein
MNIISLFAIATALIFGLAVRVLAIVRFADFSGDQIRDAYVSMHMWQGILPTLGPSSAWGDIYLPPLYFYLTFPFTVFGADLSWQAIANALLTFLAIPLLIGVVYQLLENTAHPKRLLIASVAGLWYSCLFQNIVINTGHSLAGNSGSIVFFLLVFVLLYKYQWQAQLSIAGQAVCWALYGVTLTLIANLHFAPLLVVSAAFVFSVIAFIAQRPKERVRWLLPIFSVLSGLLLLLPYWVGEISRGWTNTRGIFNLIFKASREDGYSVTLWQRLEAIANGYLSLGGDVYFLSNSLKVAIVSSLFLTAVLIISLLKFKGNWPMFGLLLGIWLLFLGAYSSTDMSQTYDPIFYKLLIYVAPIILTSVSLAYLNPSKLSERAIIYLLIATISTSVAINLSFHKNYIYSRYSHQRIANTADYQQVLGAIPASSTLCDIHGHKPNNRVYEYTNQYIVKKPLNFSIHCQSGNYVAYPKFRSQGNFKVRATRPFSTFSNAYKVFWESDVFYIFQLL